MKKIYSFVLMAAMLLVGTNAWAQIVATVTGDGAGSYGSLQEAVNKIPAGGTATITLEDDITLSAPVIIPQVVGDVTDAQKVVNREMQHITLNLAGYDISNEGSYYGSIFILFKGELNIIGEGTISRYNGNDSHWAGSWGNFSKAAIVVLGADGNAANATADRSKQEWSVLTIGENVKVESKSSSPAVANADPTKAKAAGIEGGFGIGIQDFKASDITNYLSAYVTLANLGYSTLYPGDNHPMWWANGTTASASAGAAFGVKVIVKGHVEAHHRGINVVGHVNQSAKAVENADKRTKAEYPFYAHNYPYIKIEKGAVVECKKDGLESGNGGIYGGGWAVVDICGTVKGQTGVFLKGGDVVVDGGYVLSTSTAAAQTNPDYGQNVSGNAIFITSAGNYAGETNVAVEGGATIEAGTNGAAIVDKYVTTGNNAVEQPTVQHVDIIEGTIDGGTLGGIVVTAGTASNGKTTIINADIEGGVKITTVDNQTKEESTATATNAQLSAMVPGTTNIDETPTDEPDYNVTSPEVGKIVVEPNTAKNVTLNAFGFATYSFESETTGARRKLPSGVTAYVTTGAVNSNDELVLSPIGDNKDIPAGLGVILVGTESQECVLSLDTENDPASIDPEDNKLFAASTYQASYATDENTFIYVLVGNELYRYKGTEMKANKAYLKLSNAATSYGAPQRIKMVFAETQDVENVEFEAVKAVKSIENGQVLIKRGEKVYNVQGQIVK